MFGKHSLKKRLKADLPQSQYPEIHAQVRKAPSVDQSLADYISDLKQSFERVHVIEMSDNGLAFENEVSTLINSFTAKPCLIQLIHPIDKKGLQHFMFFILALNESGPQWRSFFKNLDWVSMNFATPNAEITFNRNNADIIKVEGLLRSNHVSSFLVKKTHSQVTVELKLEAFMNKNISTKRDSVL